MAGMSWFRLHQGILEYQVGADSDFQCSITHEVRVLTSRVSSLAFGRTDMPDIDMTGIHGANLSDYQ